MDHDMIKAEGLGRRNGLVTHEGRENYLLAYQSYAEPNGRFRLPRRFTMTLFDNEVLGMVRSKYSGARGTIGCLGELRMLVGRRQRESPRQ